MVRTKDAGGDRGERLIAVGYFVRGLATPDTRSVEGSLIRRDRMAWSNFRPVSIRKRLRCVLWWPAALALIAATGCQVAGEEPALQVASEFAAAAGSDAERACELLAPDTLELLESFRPEGCQEALPTFDLPDAEVTEVQVWGDAAKARSEQDTLFLRQLDVGWRVVAAGCQEEEGGEPYQCALQGS